MNTITEGLFIETNKLPIPLSEKETNKLIDKMHQGDQEARNKIIEHNLRLVIYVVAKSFIHVDYDKKDLVSLGILGLIKAVNSYNLNKKTAFATYARSCISNEILMFLRKLKREKNIGSLDQVINYDKDGNALTLKDIIKDDYDFTEEYIKIKSYEDIRNIVIKLPSRDRTIVEMYYGFNENNTYEQSEIAEKLGVTQSYISRLLKKIVKKLSFQLEEQEIIELHTHNDNKKSKKKSKQLL